MSSLALSDRSVDRLPGFYGWWMVALAVLTLLMSAPGQTSGFAPFVEPVMAATGLSRQGIANAYMLATLLSAVVLTLGGRLFDSWGCRRMLLLACPLLALVLVGMSQVDVLIGAVGGSTVAAVAIVTIGLTGMRYTAQGVMTLASHTTVSRWFVRRRGLAGGLVGFVVAMLGPLSPLMLHSLIAVLGWRATWLLVAAVILVGLTALIWLLWRDDPESCGLQPDRSGETDAVTESVDADPWTRSEAMVPPAFWVIIFTNALNALVITATSFHIVHIGAQRGLSEEQALGFFLPMVWTSMIVGLVAMVAADRCSFRVFVPILVASMGAGLLSLAFSGYFMLSANAVHLAQPR
jgi:MFS family permease